MVEFDTPVKVIVVVFRLSPEVKENQRRTEGKNQQAQSRALHLSKHQAQLQKDTSTSLFFTIIICTVDSKIPLWTLGLSEIDSGRVQRAAWDPGSDLAAAAVPWLGAAPLVASPPATVQASHAWQQGAALVMLRRKPGCGAHHGCTQCPADTAGKLQRTVQIQHEGMEQCVSSRGNSLLPATLHTNAKTLPARYSPCQASLWSSAVFFPPDHLLVFCFKIEKDKRVIKTRRQTSLCIKMLVFCIMD